MGGGVGHLVLSGPLILAVPVAAAAGALTFLSPCVLPLVPGYLSYVTGMTGVDAQEAQAAAGGPGAGRISGGTDQGRDDGGTDDGRGGGATAVKVTATAKAASPGRPRAVVGTALFVLGFSVVFASEGVAFGGLGGVLRAHAAGLTQILGGITILLGLLFAGVFDRFPIAGRIARPSVRPRAGLAGAPLLGALFGVSWTPCIGPTLSVVMGLALASGTAARGAVLMFVYGLGLGIPFMIVALLFQRGMTAFGFARRHARLITRIGGAMLVGVGVLELTGAWTAALQWIQTHWVASYQAPL
ncbi:MAG TPA: cytochrome c biogenesis protein CcdA [Streptosporangiaceae bacterium]|nr:cytochrome c biogenesis protein CcdA [Streptosporangiaceae bacterium]